MKESCCMSYICILQQESKNVCLLLCVCVYLHHISTGNSLLVPVLCNDNIHRQQLHYQHYLLHCFGSNHNSNLQYRAWYYCCLRPHRLHWQHQQWQLSKNDDETEAKFLQSLTMTMMQENKKLVHQIINLQKGDQLESMLLTKHLLLLLQIFLLCSTIIEQHRMQTILAAIVLV